MSVFSKFFKKLKEKISKNKGASLICAGVAGFFLYKYLTYQIPEVMLSRFLILLKNNSIEECVVQGDKVYFKGIKGAKWFLVNVAMLNREQLFNLLLKRQDINVTCQEGTDSEKILYIGIRKKSLKKLLTKI